MNVTDFLNHQASTACQSQVGVELAPFHASGSSRDLVPYSRSSPFYSSSHRHAPLRLEPAVGVACRALASLSLSERKPESLADRTFEVHWIEDEITPSHFIRQRLQGLAVSAPWIDQAMALQMSLSAFLSQMDQVHKQAMIVVDERRENPLYYVRSQREPLAILPQAPFAQGGKKALYRVINMNDGRVAVFARLFERIKGLAQVPFTQDELLEVPTQRELALETSGPMLIQGKHEHVLKMHEVKNIAGKRLGYLCALIEGKNIQASLEGKNTYGMLHESLHWMLQAAEGVKFLHNQGLCHLDLKPENLLVDSHGLKVVDLDGVRSCRYRFLTAADLMRESTACYLSPELLQLQEELSCLSDQEAELEGFEGKRVEGGDLRPSDVWALGVTLFGDMLGMASVTEFNLVAIAKEPLEPLLLKMESFIEGHLQGVSACGRKGLSQLARHLFCVHPQKRCSIQEFIEHLEKLNQAFQASPTAQRLAKRFA